MIGKLKLSLLNEVQAEISVDCRTSPIIIIITSFLSFFWPDTCTVLAMSICSVDVLLAGRQAGGDCFVLSDGELIQRHWSHRHLKDLAHAEE